MLKEIRDFITDEITGYQLEIIDENINTILTVDQAEDEYGELIKSGGVIPAYSPYERLNIIKDFLLDQVNNTADYQTRGIKNYITEKKVATTELIERYNIRKEIAEEAIKTNNFERFKIMATGLSILENKEIKPEDIANLILNTAKDYTDKYNMYVNMIEDFRVLVSTYIKNISTLEECNRVMYIIKQSNNFTPETTPDDVAELVFGLLDGSLFTYNDYEKYFKESNSTQG